mgnify:CR=1 FL=1
MRNEFTNSVEFYNINQNIINWNYNEVIGEGFYQKYTDNFAFVKIKISKNEKKDSHEFINNLTDEEMPIEFSNEIIKALNFFISYLHGIKGERINLKIELIDGTYHVVDSRTKDFQIATFQAICNCFNKGLRQISESEKKMIEICKLRNKKDYFPFVEADLKVS